MRNTSIRICLTIALILFSANITVSGIDLQTAENYALDFMKSKKGDEGSAICIKAADRMPEGLYIFNFGNNEGFVIISKNSESPFVLGYNTTGEYNADAIPSNAQNWLNRYANACISSNNRTELPKPSTIATQVEPLIADTWSQMSFYSEACPTNDTNGDAVTGCVPLAMAQVMHYYKYPACGTGSINYTDKLYGEINVDFSSYYYDWANMPNKLDSTSSQIEITAVSTLIYHCAAASSVAFGNMSQGSGTHLAITNDYPKENAQYALVTYFGYDDGLTAVGQSQYTTNQWKRLMKKELSAGRPVLYSGTDSSITTGHCFIMDGYDSNDYFHFNWGWNGQLNGYFSLDSLTPYASEKITLDYSHNQIALIGIMPPEGSNIITTEVHQQPICYPNPVTDILCLNLNTDAHISIYSTDGRILYSGEKCQADNNINMSAYPKGVYILGVETKDGTKKERIIKQ